MYRETCADGLLCPPDGPERIAPGTEFSDFVAIDNNNGADAVALDDDDVRGAETLAMFPDAYPDDAP